MRLILHIGNHKTGTSSIQSEMSKYSSSLLKLGLLYPTSGRAKRAHHPIPASLHEPSAASCRSGEPALLVDYARQILSTARQSRAHSVVISSEMFIALDPRQIMQFTAFTQAFSDVTVIAYFRNQAEHIESAYKFNIMWDVTRETKSFDERLAKALDSDYHDYCNRIAPWYGVHPQTEILIKDFGAEARTGLFKGFLSTLGVENPASFLENTVKVNRSPNRLGALVIRANNRLHTHDRGALIAWLRSHGYFGRAEAKLYTPELLRRTITRFSKSNQEFSQMYGIDFNAAHADIDEGLCFGEQFDDGAIAGLMD